MREKSQKTLSTYLDLHKSSGDSELIGWLKIVDLKNFIKFPQYQMLRRALYMFSVLGAYSQ